MVRSNTYSLPGEKQAQWFRWSLYFLACLFILNCFTPLRIHYDMLRYFSIKDCIESQCPPWADPKDYMPYGYTALLLGLSKLGLLKSFSLVAINGIYLAGGLYFVRNTFQFIGKPFFLFCLVLLNWTIIKFYVHPLSEMQYLFFSLGSIYSFQLFSEHRNWGHLILAFFLAVLAFLTRTVGITLVAALFLSLIWEYKMILWELVRKNRILLLVFGVFLVGLLFFSRQLGLVHYTGVMSKQFKEGLGFTDVIKWHFTEWGEIWLNTSKYKWLSLMPAGLGEGIFLIAGVLAVAGFIYLCFIRKNRVPFVVKTYLLFYILLLFNWPFPDPRFWVPIIPLMAAVVCQTFLSSNPVIRISSLSYLLLYIFLGLASLGFMTYTSFNKKEFAKTQAKGDYRNEYEVHFFGKTLSDTATRVDPNLVQFLNKYDR